MAAAPNVNPDPTKQREEEIVRLDLIVSGPPGETYVKTWRYQADGRLAQPIVAPPKRADPHAPTTLEERVAWLAEHGWKVRTWPGGARAWRYQVTPIRTVYQIKKLRSQLDRYPRPELAGQLCNLDLALDL